MAAYRVELDQQAIDRELKSRDGTVGRVMAGFAGLATRTVHDEEVARAGGKWWPATSSITGTTLTVRVARARPHVIVPVRARALVFQVGNRIVFTQHVNHPGSAAPPRLVEEALIHAGQMYAVLGAQTAART